MAGDAGAADVDVGAAIVLIGEEHADRLRHRAVLLRLGTEQTPDVVGVGDAHAALPGGDGAQLRRVVALGRTMEVGDHARGPGLGRFLAVVLDERTEQGEVVDVAGGAHAHLAVELRICQVFVARDARRQPRLLVVDDHPGALGKPVPVAFRLAQMRRNALIENVGRDRLEDALLMRPPQAPGVDGDEHVRRAELAFVADALDQCVAAALDQVDVDAGLRREPLVERQVGVVVARGIDVDHFGLVRKRNGAEEPKEDGENTHGHSLQMGMTCILRILGAVDERRRTVEGDGHMVADGEAGQFADTGAQHVVPLAQDHDVALAEKADVLHTDAVLRRR